MRDSDVGLVGNFLDGVRRQILNLQRECDLNLTGLELGRVETACNAESTSEDLALADVELVVVIVVGVLDLRFGLRDGGASIPRGSDPLARVWVSDVEVRAGALRGDLLDGRVTTERDLRQ